MDREAKPGITSNILLQTFILDMKGLQALSVKGKIVHIFHFAGHAVSIATTQLYSCGARAARDNMQMSESDCIPIKLYLQKETASVI